jgi:hypothetical protein
MTAKSPPAQVPETRAQLLLAEQARPMLECD